MGARSWDAFEGRLVGQSDRIVDPRGYSALGEECRQLIPPFHADRKQVEDAGRFRPLLKQLDAAKCLAIMRSDGPSRLVPFHQVVELDGQECRLETVEALVVALPLVRGMAQSPQIPKPASGLSQGVVIRTYGATVTERAEVLARIEAEG